MGNIQEVRYYERTGHSVGHGFLEYFDAHGGLEVFGYPLTEEQQETIGGWTGTVQWFERARLEYHPELDIRLPKVQGGRVGAELLVLRTQN